MLKNLLAFIGVVALVAVGVFYMTYKNTMSEFDPGAEAAYTSLFKNILESKNAAEATIWKVPVEEGLTAEEVEEAMKSVANELNFSNVGELPLYKDIEAKTGKEHRFVKMYLFCDSLVAAKMLAHRDSYSAYFPCRITMVEDKTGKLWLYTMNMDLMIYGGSPLPPELKAEAERVKAMTLEIMNRAAEGDF